MRKSFSQQQRLDCQTVTGVKLNVNCRDEIVPILRGLQHVYQQEDLRDEILGLVSDDVNRQTRDDCGREGMDYWQITVLAAARLGCDLDYDKLQDLAEQHRALRQIMGIGDWEEKINFSARRIGDNLRLLQAETIDKISHLIVGAGHQLDPEAVKTMRSDSFVVETNIHYPSESELMFDGMRVLLPLCEKLAVDFGVEGFRQHEHLLKKAKKIARNIGRISSRKGPNYKKRLKKAYRAMIKLVEKVLGRTRNLCHELLSYSLSPLQLCQVQHLKTFRERTEQVRGTAERRVLKGEKVPNEEKLFSLFEVHTQLYKRGKASSPVQFGRLVLICEDGAGFITHHHVLARDVADQDVVVEQTRIVQDRLQNRIEDASFDRGFHSPENQEELASIVPHLCLPKPGAKQSVEQNTTASIRFHEARQRHSGVESTIGALQSGNGLKRCRDESELGFERYVSLAILGRNLHTLGKLLIAQEDADCAAAKTKRKSAA